MHASMSQAVHQRGVAGPPVVPQLTQAKKPISTAHHIPPHHLLGPMAPQHTPSMTSEGMLTPHMHRHPDRMYDGGETMYSHHKSMLEQQKKPVVDENGMPGEHGELLAKFCRFLPEQPF